MNYEILKNDCTNLDEIIELTKSYYNSGDIINKVYLNWQYKCNPSGLAFLFTSREIVTNQLTGQYLVIPIEYQIKGEKITGSLSLNTLTHPNHQGKGLFVKMAKKTYAECELAENFFTIGFPNPLSYPGFVKKLDFHHLGDIPLLIKPLRPINIFISFFKKEKQKHGGEITFDSYLDSEINELNFESIIDKNKYELFWNKIKVNYTISTNKDFTFLKWRYNDHPTKKYKVFYSQKNNEITGVIILRAEHIWGFNVGLIIDFMTLDVNDNILIKFSTRFFKKMRLDFITILHSKNSEYRTLIKNNFYKIPQKILPQKIHFIVRKNNIFKNEDLILKPENWKLTFGDYDIF